MARPARWRASPGEKIRLAASLESDLESGAILSGTNMKVSVWSETSSGGFNNVTSDFTVAGIAVNPSALSDEDGVVIIPAQKGLAFWLTMSTTPGTYEVRIEGDSDDGGHPVTARELVVEGPGAP